MPNEDGEQDYQALHAELDAYGQVLCHLLKDVLGQRNIAVHSISHRVKNQASTQKKMAGNPEKYPLYTALHDFLGVRIITHYPDEIDLAAELIEQEFAVDRDASVDKRALLDPDRFGYLSLHYVLSLKEPRRSLPEYRRFAAHRFELQIRTILQHAWAEIEHDLGYKTSGAVPSAVRRSFSRLAGLLEIADEQFQQLRDELASYEVDAAEMIKDKADEVELNLVSLTQLAQDNEMIRNCDKFVAELFGEPLDLTVDRVYLTRRLNDLSVVGLETVGDALTALREREELIRLFLKELLKDHPKHKPSRSVPPGISLFHLAFIIAAEQGEEALARLAEARGSKSGHPKRILEILAAARSQMRM